MANREDPQSFFMDDKHTDLVSSHVHVLMLSMYMGINTPKTQLETLEYQSATIQLDLIGNKQRNSSLTDWLLELDCF